MNNIKLKDYSGVDNVYPANQIELLNENNNLIPFIDTSNANAKSNNIAYGEVGYANNQRVVGNSRDAVDVQGIIKEYEVKAGQNINAGDFVEFFNEYLSRQNSCRDAPSAILLEDNKVFIAHSYSTSRYLYGTIVTINGTEMTPVTTQLSTISNSC